MISYKACQCMQALTDAVATYGPGVASLAGTPTMHLLASALTDWQFCEQVQRVAYLRLHVACQVQTSQETFYWFSILSSDLILIRKVIVSE